ncbi:hypothetical protein H2200_009730 [Cladophialophora chaetospira]|uniref:F-box domain-containing protein n=1 Tax=Cladophialophora chaetospira TaxID=386627 RepID=A0AA38X2Z5_9EURO|nr:hypothetical protein H2200_009730 [Cladophialophora chaetospira]
MARNILDLPLDLIFHIRSFLSTADLQSFGFARQLFSVRLSHYLLIRGSLYWNFRSDNVFKDLKSQYGDYATCSRSHALIRTLKKHPEDAKEIRLLILDYDMCSECRPFEGLVFEPSPCRQFSRALLRRLFPKLRTLVLNGKYDFMLDDSLRRLNPRIRELGLGDLTQHFGKPHLEVKKVLRVLRSPTPFDKVRIFDTGLLHLSGALQYDSNLLNDLDHLELSNVTLQHDGLDDLLGACTSLRRFAFSKGCRNMFSTAPSDLHHPFPYHAALETDEIGDALAVIYQTVESLELDYSCRHREPADDTLIEGLAECAALQNLTIDPTLLLGRTVCPERFSLPDYDVAPPQRPSTLHRRLPNNLEKLTLIIDVEQLRFDHKWAREILQGILAHNHDLTRLRTIYYAPVTTANSLIYCECSGEDEHECPGFDLACALSVECSRADAEPYYEYDLVNNFPREQRYLRLMQELFEPVGVNLIILDDQAFQEGAWRQ